MMARIKELELENAWLKKIYAEERLKADMHQGCDGKKVVRPSRRREIAKQTVTARGISISLGCQIFTVSETCYRYEARRNVENEQIADWLM